MSRSLLIIILLVCLGCSTKHATIAKKEHFNQPLSKEYLMSEAIFYAYAKKPKKAIALMTQLYKSTNDTIFLQEALLIRLENNIKESKLLPLLKQAKKNKTLKRLEVLLYLQDGKAKIAKEKLLSLLKSDKDYQNYELLGDLYLQEKQPKRAIKAYKAAYLQSKSLEIVLKYSNLLLSLKQTGLAKRILLKYEHTHKLNISVNLLLCKIYQNEQNQAMLIKTYEKMYKASNNLGFIYEIISILSMQKDYKQALKLALKYNVDPNTKLFLLYVNNKLNAAFLLALKSYYQTHSKIYLLKAAVFANEINPKDIKKVVSLFRQGIDKNSSAVYLNYYGYLLIDKNIDIPQGISLVKRALKQDSTNAYYIDSLAWGYYKLNLCKKANTLMLMLIKNKDFLATKEAKMHIRLIRRCMQKPKRRVNEITKIP